MTTKVNDITGSVYPIPVLTSPYGLIKTGHFAPLHLLGKVCDLDGLNFPTDFYKNLKFFLQKNHAESFFCSADR